MLSVDFSMTESILLLAVGWAIIWVVSAFVHKRFIARDRADVKPFFEESVYYEYFCPNGHYLGKHEPALGTLCDVCVEQGHIRATCMIDGTAHDAKFVTKMPPYQIACPKHGTHEANSYTHNNRQFSLREWLELNRANPLPIPLPTDNPLPDSLRSQTRGSSDPRQFLEPVQRRVRSLEKILGGRLQALPALIAQQQRVLRRWKTVSLILALLLLLVICVFMSVPSYQLFNPAAVLYHLPGAMLWAANILLYITLCFLPLLYLMTRRESIARPVPRHEIRLSLLLAELLTLIVFPLIFQGWFNSYAIVPGLAYAVVVELIANVIEGAANLNFLRKREGYFKDKLEDVQTSSKNIAEAIAFISNWNKQVATPPSQPEPDQAT